ncbi:MAG: hypothetical protein WCS27_10560 [Victivallaceae bacterium]
MHKQTLKNLLHFHTNVTFKEFHRELFPDFTLPGSVNYLNNKFRRFHDYFFLFLAELDEFRLEYLADAIVKRYGSDDPEHCDIVEKAEKIIARSKVKNLSERVRNKIMQEVDNLLVYELYPFKAKLDSEGREIEFAVIHDLIDQLESISRGEF